MMKNLALLLLVSLAALFVTSVSRAALPEGTQDVHAESMMLDGDGWTVREHDLGSWYTGRPTLKTYQLPAELSERREMILAALTSNVKPDIWKDAGGSSTASAIDNVLIVSTTEAVHDEVETFLQKIESAFKVYQQKPQAVLPEQR